LNREKELYARLKVGDSEAEFRGDYGEVWRSINRFLTKAGSLTSPVKVKTSDYIPREGSLGASVMLLRSQGWFDAAKTVKETHHRIKENMAFNCDLATMSKELIRMVRRGVLKRQLTEGGYVYTAPWTVQQTE
jgi:hypothetical protein